MRRAFAWIGLALAGGGFVLLALSIRLNIHFLIPVGMIAGAFILLLLARRMPSDIPDKPDNKEAEGEADKDERA